MCYPLPVIALELFTIVTHTYAVYFSIKMHFYESNKIFFVKNKTKLSKTIKCLRKEH